MSVRLMVLSTLTAMAALPAGLRAQEPQPLPRSRVIIRDNGGPEVIRNRIQILTQRRYRLGVTVDMLAGKSDSLGASIQAVTPGGPAAKAGLKSGDIITKFNGKTLTAPDNTRAGEDESLPGVRLVALASQLKADETVSIEYVRDGDRKTATLVTGNEPMMTMEPFGDRNDFFEFPGTSRLEFQKIPGMPGNGIKFGPETGYSMFFGGPLMDLELAPLNTDLGAYFGTTEGVLVINVPKESTLGVKAGDVVQNVDGRKVSSPNNLLRILRTYEPGESFKLDIMRNKARTTVTGSIKQERDE